MLLPSPGCEMKVPLVIGEGKSRALPLGAKC